MSDLYQLTIAVVDITEGRVVAQMQAINHSGQDIPDTSLFYLSVLADMYLVAATGSEYAPSLTSAETWPGLPETGFDQLDSPLLEGILDAHPPTLATAKSNHATLLKVQLSDVKRNEFGCREAQVTLSATEESLFAHLCPGIVFRIVHSEDPPLEALLARTQATGEGNEATTPIRHPRLNYRLTEAVHNGDLEAARRCLDEGANPDAGLPGSSVLMIAAHTGQTEIAALLIQRGAQVNALGICDETALHKAVNYKHKAVARLLLDAGAALDLITELGKTPMHLAAESEDPSWVHLLLDAGADIEQKNDSEESPIYSAIACENTKTVAALLERGADANAGHENGRTPLMRAVDQPKLLKLLLAHGAKLDPVSKRGETALDIARRVDCAKGVKVLQRAAKEQTEH